MNILRGNWRKETSRLHFPVNSRRFPNIFEDLASTPSPPPSICTLIAGSYIHPSSETSNPTSFLLPRSQEHQAVIVLFEPIVKDLCEHTSLSILMFFRPPTRTIRCAHPANPYTRLSRLAWALLVRNRLDNLNSEVDSEQRNSDIVVEQNICCSIVQGFTSSVRQVVPPECSHPGAWPAGIPRGALGGASDTSVSEPDRNGKHKHIKPKL